MKRFWIIPLFFLMTLPVYAYKVQFAEQWYRLYHHHLYEYPDDCLENISYLEQALKSDFANPLNALGKISNTREWEKYRDLFKMHVSIALIQQYLTLGRNYDKQNAYFYNYPWKQANLDSLNTAESVYTAALTYWEEAKKWAQASDEISDVQLEDLQFWMDEAWRINTGDLDYQNIIQKQLDRLEKVREDFQAMGPGTY